MSMLKEICNKGIDGVLQEGDKFVEELKSSPQNVRLVRANDKHSECTNGFKRLIKHRKEIYENVPDYEQYAYLYSKTFSSEVFDEDDLCIDQYVMIEYGNRRIYRKCAAKSGICSGEISLGNRSIRELGIDNKIYQTGKIKVKMSKSNWFMYQMFNGDKSLKMVFIIGIFSLLCTIFSTLKDIIELFLL